MRFVIDTNVGLYALGGESEHREPCRRLIALMTEGTLQGEASAEFLQEIAHVRFRRTGNRAAAAKTAEDFADLLLIHPVEVDDARRALDLFSTVEALDARDAVHAATCLNRDIPLIVSVDRGFAKVPGLRRVSPADAEEALVRGYSG